MDIGVDQGIPRGDLIELKDGSNRFRDPVTGNFDIDRFDLTFDQYRRRRNKMLRRRAQEEAAKIYRQYRDSIKPDRSIHLKTNRSDTRLLLVGTILILLILVL